MSLLRSTVSALTDGVVLCDADRRVLACNDRFLELCGLEPMEVRAVTHIDELLQLAPFGRPFADAVTNPLAQAFGCEGVDREGRTLRLSGRPIEHGHYLITLSDLSSLRHAQRLAVERRDIERMKAGFLSVVSHELRTPLTSIGGSLGLIAGGVAGALSPKAARLIEIAQLNCERLIANVNDILDLERAESGELTLRLESHSLRAIVTQAVERSRQLAARLGVHVHLEPGDNANVRIDRERFMQVLLHLLSNAIKYSPRGASVAVSVRLDAERGCVSVQDQGPGIAPELHARIFEKFSQGDSSDTRAQGGMGLGLSIARTYVERMGGQIDFDRVRPSGTRFFVVLPAVPVDAIDTGVPIVVERPAEPSSAQHLRILHVEDDVSLTEVVATLLEDVATVVSAHSLLHARERITRETFDLVILDIRLSDGEGLDLLPLFDRDAAPAVLLYTAHEPHQPLPASVDGFIVKSRTSLAELLRLVRTLPARDAGSIDPAR